MSAAPRPPDATPPPDARAPGGLLRDSDGAIMLLGAFMAMLLVGMLYYVVGVGESIVYRERMQDAADATAFSAAAIHARGMNFIALINVVMSALLAVLVALKIVELLCIGGIAVASALAVPTYGATVPSIGVLSRLEARVAERYGTVRTIVETALRVGNTAERVVRVGTPLVAQGRAVLIVMEAYQPPARVGFVYPIFRPLPVENMPPEDFCEHARPEALTVAWIPMARELPSVHPLVIAYLVGAYYPTSYLAARMVCSDVVSDSTTVQRVRGGLELGDEDFQIRGFAIGSRDFDQEDRVIRIANRWQDDTSTTSSVFRALRQLGRLSVAQAEFYFDGDDDRDQWLWKPSWRARLRRFRLPSGLTGGALDSACAGAGGGGCGGASGLDLSILERIIVH